MRALGAKASEADEIPLESSRKSGTQELGSSHHLYVAFCEFIMMKNLHGRSSISAESVFTHGPPR